jgi:hypothetical protein
MGDLGGGGAKKNMLNVLPSAVAETRSDWVVRLGIQLMGDRREAVADEDLERMLELMMRTSGVRSAAATADSGAALYVDLDLTAPRGELAMDRARALVAWCTRYAGLGAIEVRHVQVVPERATVLAPADLSV